MKRIFAIGFIAILATIILTSAVSRKRKKKHKQFRGTITYDISYESSTLSDIQLNKLQKTISVKMYDGMSKFDIMQGERIVQTIISNPTTDQYIILIEAGLNKAALIAKYSDVNNDSTEMFTTEIDYSDDTKIIAGYKCKKAVVTFTPKDSVDAEERMFSVFYSPELGDTSSNSNSPYAGIPGELLETYNVTPQLITKYTATEVKKGKVKDLDFFLPSDYKEFTVDQAEEMIKYLKGE